MRPFVVGTALLLSLAGCQSYAPLPLDAHPHLAAEISQLKAELPESWSGAGLNGPLDMATVSLLAVENNPDLAAARANRGIADAQVIQAGILPNPQLSASYGFLRAGPGTSASWSAGLSEDVRALVILSPQRRKAELGARSVAADLLWQEWQIIGKVRLLYIDTIEQRKLLALLSEADDALKDRYERDRRAVGEGGLTLSAVSPDLAAVADLDGQIGDISRAAASRQQEFDLLLGLDPAVELRLADDVNVPLIAPAGVEKFLFRSLPNRPDLVALRLGYSAQEESVRSAILAQFPALLLGGTFGRDNSRVYSIGPQITMDLPVFNRNQGNIAIEKATRQKLHDEFTNRMTAAAAEIRGLLSDLERLQPQLAAARLLAEDAEQTESAAENAYGAQLVDARTHADLVMAAVARRQQVIMIEQTLLEQQAALSTLTGVGMPVVDPVTEPVKGQAL